MKKLLLLATFILFGISSLFAQQGFTCTDPIVIQTLPYSTTDNTANYGDALPLEGTPGGAGGCGSANSYLNGNDVVYSYTAVTTGVINVTMTPTIAFSGIFAYSSCANIGVNCLAGVANGTTGVRSFDLPVTAGSTYYIVISTWAAPQTTGYTLSIQTLNCLLPTTLSVNSITSTSAQLSWANPSGATSWEVAVQTAGTPFPTEAGTTVNTNNNYLVSGLTSSTSYQYYVRANCGNGTFSGWAGPYEFNTSCGAFTVPFQEGFNSTSTSESCWTIVNSNNDADAWNTNYTTSPYEGNQSATLNTDFNAGNNNDWLISPQIILTGNQVLKFHYRVQSSFEPNEFSVLLSTNGTNLADFTSTLIPLTTYDNIAYTQATVSLAGFTGPVNIAWHVPAGALDGWRIYIDNVIVENLATCPEPTLVTANEITSTSASIGWLESGVATNWEVLSVPCGSPVPLSSTVGQSVTSNTYTLSGLSPLTCYTVYVRALCAENDISDWTVNPVTFTTQVSPPVCGQIFTDAGGPNGNYPANSNSIVTICPTTIGEIVTVNFTSFDTEANWDGLYVFDGNSITAPQISSGNLAGFVPGGLAGAFWGTSLPGPFLSTSPDGCLTFQFRSDGTAARPGWTANVVCAPAPNCLKPTDLTLTNTTETSITFGWTESESATSWEVLALPSGSPAPSVSTSGELVTTNPATITGLVSGTTYSLYVRSVCPSTGFSFWSFPLNTNTLITNDECDTATIVPVNYDGCAQVTPGRITGATASSVPFSSPCIGTADDDVWFQFVATNSSVVASLQNVAGTSTLLNMAMYSGACGNSTQLNCSAANALSIVNSNLIVGNTYFLRVYSNANTPQNIIFNLCVTTPSTCVGGESVCGVNNYANSTGIPSLGTIGCLNTSPNPTYFNIKISESGSVNMLLTQSTIGSGTANIDVDYAAWGPFPDQATACAAINGGQTPGIGVPVTQQTGCSYSASPTEHFNIANAIAGEYYIILITNFSNQAGFINLTVENTSTGSIDCTGIRMQAFIDNNANGTKEADEAYFPLGQFQYEINNNGTIHNITSPSGVYSIFDDNPSNSYDLDYNINANYASTYSTSASYNNVIVTSAGMTTYNFPITVLQNHNDLGVTIVPVNAPRAGTTYKNKIVYTNNGTQTIAAGTLTYTVNSSTTITNISQSGTTAITNGFTYNFNNLLPFESRTITVTISVPSIPTVSIGQLLTNTASVVPPSGDIVASNDSSVSTQAIIAAYDPNDKTESHGDKILFSSFTSDDYLEYTIRFENNGNAGAIDVVVSDVLDNQLDETSLIMTNASHSYTLDRVSNTLVWTFANILLPVSIPDTDIGKGFITFKIKPKPGYAVGDIIPNSASIYFDSNPPIVTNTFNTEFVAALGNTTFTNNSILLYPNPATHLVTISIQNSTESLESVVIHDMLGKKIKAISDISSNQISIDVVNFAKGVYLVEITSDNNLKLIKKLIIK